MKHHGLLLFAFYFLLCLTSCSETRNLAEGEVLYTGIKRIDYDKPPKQEPAKDDTVGVITAIGNAYNTVSNYLAGVKESSAPDALSPTSTPASPSVLPNPKLDQEAYAVAKSEVKGVLAYKPNNSLMGSSYHRQPLAVGLWTYNKYLYSKRRFGRWMFNSFAATPVTLTTVNPRIRTQVAQNTLRNYGYFRGQASFDTIPQRHPRKAKISYQVHPGPLFHLDSIAYLGFPDRADSLIRATMRWSMLHRADPFSVVNLDEERKRLCDVFRNHGYYYFRPEYIVYRADTVARPLNVQLQVVPSPSMTDNVGRQYYMGRTRINIYENEATELVDTIGRHSVTMAYSGRKGRMPLKMRAIRRFISYRRGDLYKLNVQNAVQENLSGMGIFSQLSMRYTPRDTTASCDTLDVEITARLDKPYNAEFKGNIAGKSNGLVGPGVSFTMSKQNVFRGAETISFSAYGSYEWMTGAQTSGKHSLMNSFEWGTSMNLVYPRLLLLGLGKYFNRRAKATTTYKINADWMNRSGYFSRVTFGARVAHTYQRRSRVLHEVVPFRLDYEKQLHTTAKFDSIVAVNPALYASLRNQFVPSAQYTITLTNPASRHHQRRITFSLKEAGNVTSLAYRLGGKSLNEKNKHLFGVPFAQYVRFTAEYTQRYRIGQTRTYMAGRLFAGVIYSFGNSRVAPYADLFSIGGANSIRAFGVRTIGPGSYHPANSSYSYLDQIGDLKLEANVEYRFPLVSNLGGAIFVDAGNVWLMKSDAGRPGASVNAKTMGKEIALGTGFGLRYDLDFLVIRFDVGVGIHAPYDTGKSGYYNMTRFWDSLGFHLAVGYPF